MNMRARQRGFLIIVGMILIAIGALVAVVATFLSVTRSESAGGHLGSTQALMIAQAGIERAVYEYRRGQACNSLSSASSGLGEGSFAVTATLYSTTAATLAAGGVSAGQQLIPVNSVAGYASHGRIRLDDEEINYTGVSTSAGFCGVVGSECFTGAIRGVNPTTAAAHAAGTAAYQNQCLIRSVGTASNTSTRRTIEANVPAWSGSAFYDGTSIAYTNTLASLGTLSTDFPAGTNLVIAVVSIRSTQGGVRLINAGDIQLRRGDSTPALAANVSNVLYANGGAPDNNTFLNETQFLLYRDTAAAANQSYSVWIAQSTNPFGNARGEVKLLAINNPPLSDFVAGNTSDIGTALTTLQTLNTTLPAGDYAVLAAVELDNAINATSVINAGNLQLRASGVTLASNQYRIDLDDNLGEANRGTGFLLLGRVSGAAANMSYDVVAQSVAAGPVGAARILVIGGLKSALVDSGSVTLAAGGTTISTLNTGFPAGENVVIAANQYNVTAGGDRSILANGEDILFNGAEMVTNELSYFLCRTGDSPNCDDFASGLLARQSNASANVSFAVDVDISDTTVVGETKLMALHIEQGLIDWVEVFQ